MLSKPFAGWTSFSVKDFSFTASYLTDVPNDFVKALCIALRDDISTMVVLDGEGEGDCEIMFNTYHDTVSAVHFVPGSDIKVETVFWDMDILMCAKEFVRDIEEHYADWRNWGYDDEPCEIDLNELKELINIKETKRAAYIT